MFKVTVNKEFNELHRDMVNAPHLIVQQMRFAVSAAGNVFVRSVQGSIMGGGWAPNSSWWQGIKEKLGYYSQPLRRTGIMSKTVTWRLEAMSANGVSGSVGWRSGQNYPANIASYHGVKGRKKGWPSKKTGVDWDPWDDPDGMLEYFSKDGATVSFAALKNEAGFDNRPSRPFMEQALQKAAADVVEIFGVYVFSAFFGGMGSISNSSGQTAHKLLSR